jgi:hypothetical protein
MLAELDGEPLYSVKYLPIQCHRSDGSWLKRIGRSIIMTKRHEWTIRLAALLVVLLALGAVARTEDFKKGAYSVTAGGAKWAINFGDNNKLTFTRDGEIAAEGTYKVTGDELEVTDERGPIACGGEQKTGKYKWRLEEKKLTMTKVEDPCEGRAHALTSHVWVRE